LWLAGCSIVAPVIKIGLVGPFEGRHRQIGYDTVYSARLAIREINKSGGVGKYRVGLVALDDFGNPEIAVQVAQSLVIDPGVVAVVGHWLSQTTAVAEPVYEQASLPFLAGGSEPFGPSEPELLPARFRQAYEAVTPFDESPGPYSGATYDAITLLLKAMAIAAQDKGEINRQSLTVALEGLKVEGLTGQKFQP
jgi:branched-chain amino acid transport system substrate-binding protein